MGQITGAKVAAITVAFFGVIIAVNLGMAYKAVTTFPGLQVANSYDASQEFDKIRLAQEALGWSVKPEYQPEAKRFFLAFTTQDGAPAPVNRVKVVVGRATTSASDQTPELLNESGLWTAPLELGQGPWMLHIDAVAEDGTAFTQRIGLYVK